MLDKLSEYFTTDTLLFILKCYLLVTLVLSVFKPLWEANHDPAADNFQYSGTLRPRPYSFKGLREVPDNIVKPDYAGTGGPGIWHNIKRMANMTPPVHTSEEISIMKKVCKIARGALDAGHAKIAPGVTTEEVDKVVHDFIIENNAYPSPLNYYGFPRSCCTSINEVICHGIPDTRKL